MRLMVDCAAAQVGNGETQVPIPPHQIAMFETEAAKPIGLKVSANVRVTRPAQERLEVNDSFCAIVEEAWR